MSKTKTVVGQVQEKFSQKRRVPRLPLVIVALLVGIAGVYLIVSSLAATDVLFNATKPSDYNLIQAAPGAVNQVPDPLGQMKGNVISLTVHDNDELNITPNPRAELLSKNIIQPGQEFWTSSNVMIPSNFPTIPADGWLSLEEIFGQPFSGPSPWGVRVYGDQLQWSRNATYGYDVPFSMPLQKNHWYHVVTHEKFGTDGFIEEWIDGQQITFFANSPYNPHNVAPTTRLNMQTMDSTNNQEPNYIKISNYRKKGMFDVGTVYYGPLIVANTQAAVDSAYATDEGTSAPPPPAADTTPPAVSVTAPASGSTVSGTSVNISATASDNVGVAGVQFKLDGNNLGSEDVTSPYNATWDTTKSSNGPHTLTAVARDTAGNTKTSSSINVTVSNSSGGASDLLFNGTKISDYSNQSAPGAVTLVPDPAGSGQQVFRMTVSNADVAPITPTKDPRAQLVTPGLIKIGDTFWLSTKIYLPSDFPTQPPGWFCGLQVYGPPFNGSPPWSICFDGPAGKQINWSRNGTYSDMPWGMPMVKGQWINVLLHEKLASDGFVEMWINGQPVTFFDGSTNNPHHVASTQHLVMQTADKSNNGGNNTGDLQSYRQVNTLSTSTLYEWPMKIGKTREAVDDTTSSPGTPNPPPTPSPDTTKPTVNFSSPANNAAVSGVVTATAAASDDVGVTKVEFSLDGSLKMTDVAAPYNYSFDSKTLSNGNHTLAAKAYDAAGNNSSTTITVNVQNTDTTPPSAPTGLNATAANATTVNLRWNASTDPGLSASGVAKYNVLRDGVVIAQVNTTTYSDTSATADTNYTYAVQAIDAAGNVSANSSTATAKTPSANTTDLLFNGTKINQYLNQSAPGAITEVADPLGGGETVFKFVVKNGDVAPVTPTENPRAQLVGPGNINKGDDVWLENKFLLPSDFPSKVPGWMALFATYGPPFDGSGAWGVEVNGDQIQWQRNDTYNWDVPWSMPIVKNQWVTVLVHEKFDTNGFIEMWVNGQPVTFFAKNSTHYYNPNNVSQTTHLTMQTADHSEGVGPDSGRVMDYHQVNMFDSTTTYHGPLIEGKTRAAVEAAAAANDKNTQPPTGNPTPDTTPPTKPAQVTASAISANQVNINWNASTDSGGSGLAGYNVYRDGKKLNSKPVTTTSYGDSTVDPGISYTYAVEAVDGAGNKSSLSNTSTVKTPVLPDNVPPSIPGRLKATAKSATRVDLSWRASTDTGGSGIAGYKVYRDGKLLNQELNVPTSYSDTSVQENTTSHYQVSAVDKAGNDSDKTAAIKVTTPKKSNADNPGQGNHPDTPSPVRPRVAITVLDRHHKPAYHANVTLYSQTSQTDRRGAAYFTNIPVGRHDVAVQYDGRIVSHTVDVKSAPTSHSSQSPQHINFSLTHTALNPLLLGIPALVLLAGGLIIFRPWNNRLAIAGNGVEPSKIVSSENPEHSATKPGSGPENPGTVYTPEDQGSTHDSQKK